MLSLLFCYGDEENGHRDHRNGYLTDADQNVIRKVHGSSVKMNGKLQKYKKITKKLTLSIKIHRYIHTSKSKNARKESKNELNSMRFEWKY